MNRTWTIALTLLCVALTSGAQIALKVGVSGVRMQTLAGSASARGFLLQALLAPMVLLGLTLYVVSTVLWLLVLAKLDVSFAYPFVSLGFVFTALYAFLVLNEPMAAYRVIGIALIVAGVAFVARS
jgi:multidrug transporter EmrE-like cation transporter